MTPNGHPPRVLVFDSGVGSLSIGAEIHRLLPDLNLLYCMDRGGFPYGQWQEQPLAQHICGTILSQLERHPCDMVVVACNSASTTVLPALRSQLAIPVVGVVPAIKPAASQSKTGIIGLLATPGTIARPYTDQLIHDFAAHCQVIKVGDPALAGAVEALFWQGDDNKQAWRRAAQAFTDSAYFADMDTVVLACTHFPLVQKQLDAAMRALGKTVNWVDSGQAIARRVAQLLQQGNSPRQLGVQGRQEALLLGVEDASSRFATTLKARHIDLLNAG